MGWFAGLTPVGKWVVGGVGLLLLVIVGLLLLRGMQHDAKDAGRNEVIVHTQGKVIEDVQTAKEVREALPARTDKQRVADCMRRSRTPELCQ